MSINSMPQKISDHYVRPGPTRLGISRAASCPDDHTGDKTEHGYHVASVAWAGHASHAWCFIGTPGIPAVFECSAHQSFSLIVLSLRMPYATLGIGWATGGIFVGGTCMICWRVFVRMVPTCVRLSRRSRARVSASSVVPLQHPTTIGRVGNLARNRLQR